MFSESSSNISGNMMERVFCMIPEKNGKKGGARRYLKPYHLMPTKNSKGRSLTPAPYVMGCYAASARNRRSGG